MNEVAVIMKIWRFYGQRWEPARARAAMASVLAIKYAGHGSGFGQP